jgi:hypothetical protein
MKSKIARLAEQGDQAVLDFLGIVLYCEGLASHYDGTFNYYRSQWGQDRLEEVRPS